MQKVFIGPPQVFTERSCNRDDLRPPRNRHLLPERPEEGDVPPLPARPQGQFAPAVWDHHLNRTAVALLDDTKIGPDHLPPRRYHPEDKGAVLYLSDGLPDLHEGFLGEDVVIVNVDQPVAVSPTIRKVPLTVAIVSGWSVDKKADVQARPEACDLPSRWPGAVRDQ